MQEFEYTAAATRVVFGAGTAVGTVPRTAVDSLGARRVMVFAGDAERELADRITTNLANRVVASFADVRPHVPLAVAERARAAARSANADCLLSIGGGWTTGIAKAVALELRLPIVAIPTTYAGSEATPTWTLTAETGPLSGTDPGVVPQRVIYDPLLTLSLPIDVTVVSGLGALALSAEALWSPRADPVTVLHAQESIRALAVGLPALVAVPSDLTARASVLYGAWLAGMSYAATGPDLHARASSLLSHVYALPDAATRAVLLPHAAALACARRPSADGLIAAALDFEGFSAMALMELGGRLGAPASLRELGLGRSALPDATERLTEALGALRDPVTPGQAETLLLDAWHGRPPGGLR